MLGTIQLLLQKEDKQHEQLSVLAFLRKVQLLKQLFERQDWLKVQNKT